MSFHQRYLSLYEIQEIEMHDEITKELKVFFFVLWLRLDWTR
jgi:hypothetical protein